MTRAPARAAGVCYLLNIVTILLAVIAFRGLVVPGDPAATARNLQAHEPLFRLGISLELLSTAFSIAVAALLYELLRSVNATLSLLAAFYRLVACAAALLNYVFQLAPLQMQAFSGLRPEELPALGLLLHRLHGPAQDIVILFFGFHFLLLGHLIYRSTFMPRALGVLAASGGLSALVFLAPPLARQVFPYVVISGLVAEVSLTFWLLTANSGAGDIL